MNEVFLRVLIYFQNCESPLYDKNFHEWKIIPLNLLNRYLGKNFNFHSNLQVKSSFFNHFWQK